MSKSETPTLDIESATPQDSLEAAMLDWDGPDDIANPKNWSFGKRAFNTALPGIFTFLMYEFAETL